MSDSDQQFIHDPLNTRVNTTYKFVELWETKQLQTYKQKHRKIASPVFCHAPFTSMNLQQNGDVLVCCYNRDYVLGKFPEQSLKEIWFGEKANELRKQFLKDNIHEGCHLCMDQLESKNYAGLYAQKYDEFSIPSNEDIFTQYPKVIEFEISNQCNLECTMCTGYYSSSIRKNREKLPPAPFHYSTGLVEQLQEFIPHLSKAKFLGGEPFLIKEYIEIWESIGELNPSIEVSITTNATILNERVKNALEKLNAWLVISIDSLEKETYTKIRINANFERVLKHIDYFLAYSRKKGTGLSFAVCPMIDNWHELPDLLKYCNNQDITLYLNTVIRPEKKSLKYLAPQELEKIIATLKKAYWFKGIFLQGNEKNKKQYTSLINQLSQWKNRYSQEKIDRFKTQVSEEVKQLQKIEELPPDLDPANEVCYREILLCLPQANLLNSSKKTANYNYLIRDLHLRYDEIAKRHAPKSFVVSFIYAANTYVKVFSSEKAQSWKQLTQVINMVSEILSKHKYWQLETNKLYYANPIEMLENIKHIQGFSIDKFEQYYLKA